MCLHGQSIDLSGQVLGQDNETLVSATVVVLSQADSTLVSFGLTDGCLLYTSPSPRDATLSRMPSSA